MEKKTDIEITAPVGSYESLAAAVRAGADSVYFGMGNLNLRSRASVDFTEEDLKKIAVFCRKCRVKSYLTLNAIIYDREIPAIKAICDFAKSAGVSAIIASDLAVIIYAHSIGMEVHISVQANVSNIEAVKFFAGFADVIVLARELTLKDIANIKRAVEDENIRGPSGKLVRLELFAHGALCVSIAGKCYMSLAEYNSSANRGECYQNCRRAYRVTDEYTGSELLLDNKYVMSPRDLCTIRIIDRILEAGVSVLKIEGRGRSADYVYATTKAYRKAVDLYRRGDFTNEKAEELEKELAGVFNRGFWNGGYYLGERAGEWSGIPGNKAEKHKRHIGRVSNYFSGIKVAEITLNAGGLKIGDEIWVIGHTTGAAKQAVEKILINGRNAFFADKGDVITIPVSEKVRRNDKVYLLTS